MPITIIKKPVEDDADENLTSFQRWYRKNKAWYNLKRRKRYHNDDEYRERVMEQSLETMQKIRRKQRSKESESKR
jgi:hypothetical protein